jgi:hypothetical protein
VDSPGVTSLCLHPSVDFQYLLASVHPGSYRPFEVFTRWCLCPQRDHLWCHIYLCLQLLVVILSLQRPGFSPRPFHVGFDGQSGTQIGHYKSTNGPYSFIRSFVRSFIHSFIHSFFLSFFHHQWCIVAIND